MSLSISSSKLLLSVASAVLLLMLFNAWLHVSPPVITHFHNQWIKNHAMAERHVYRDERPPVVIVGSSMAARLEAAMVHPQAYNLSFSSAGSSTGLEILVQRGDVPEVILVETNSIELALQSEMLESLFTPVLWQVKRYLRFLQYQFQPGNILMSLVKSRFGNSQAEKALAKPDSTVYEREKQRQILVNHNTTGLENTDFEPLQRTLSNLVSRGSRVIFFDMPVAAEIATSPRYTMRRAIRESLFADYAYIGIAEAELDQFATTDGRHLTVQGASAFARVLSSRLQVELDGQKLD